MSGIKVKSWTDRMPVLVVSSLLMMFVSNVSAQGLYFAGYADFEFKMEDPSGKGTSNFDNHHFNFIGFGEITTDIFVASEVEYEHSGGEIGFEYGYVGYTGFKDVRIMAGKFIVPFGRFQKDLHPTWINKMVDRPNGFKDILPQTYDDTGVWVSGTRSVSGGNRLVYDLYAVNGLKGVSGDGIRGMRPGITEDPTDENNKAFGARLGFEAPPSGFDFGASIYRSRYAKNLDLVLYGADAAYRHGGLELRAEIVAATQEVDTAAAKSGSSSNMNMTGGYGQIAYRLDNNFEPVLRFSARDMEGESSDQSRFSLGLNYYLSPASSIRLNYHINSEKSGFETDNDLFALQFNVGF